MIMTGLSTSASSMPAGEIPLGFDDCGCKAGWHPGTVLDPFAGRGTAGIMALKLGRRFIGFDLNPDFMELTNKNLKNSRVKIKRKKKIPIE